MKKISKKIIAMALAGAIVLGGIGTMSAVAAPAAVQTASAASGSQYVGGGILTYKKISGIYIQVSYYHPTKKHSVSARVGTGRMVKDVRPARQTAKVTATGLGTTQFWWATY